MNNTQSRQWLYVGLIVAGLGIGTWGLTRYGTVTEGAQVGDLAPDFRVERVGTGDSIGLRSGYAGDVVLVNFWATWCGPCKKEMPSMERAYQAYKDRGFRIAAVSLDEGDGAKVQAFTDELGLTFEILHDRSNVSLQVYQAIGVPHSVLIGRDGRVAWVALGAEDWHSAAYQTRIEALLAEGE